MSTPKKSEVPVSTTATDLVSVTPAASIDDTAAYLREAPCVAEVLNIVVPPKVRAKGTTFAQQELRKLDADLGPETNVALVQIQQLGPDRVAADLGPVSANLRGLDALVERRAQSAAVLTRLRALLDYSETQQRVLDHDAVLILEAVGDAVGYLGQFDDAMRDRYSATLDVLNARKAKAAEGRARARATTPVPPKG